MAQLQKITPCLWFDTQAEEAANFYISVFDNGRITKTTRYSEEGFEVHGRPAGSVMTVEFELDGMKLTGLNGGPMFRFNEAVSFQIACSSQDEIDRFWSTLSAGGEEGPCGWLKDRFGLSWQVVPVRLGEMLADPDPQKVERVTRAFLQMKKFDLHELEEAYEGRESSVTRPR